MDLDRIQARIRPRRPWEAVDLGFAMVSAWRGPLYRCWIAPALPVFCLVGALAYHHPLVAWLVLWWLKPLLDRVPLHFLSRALFGDLPRWRSFMREVPGLWARGFLRSVISGRFDLARSSTMPVGQLEGLTGRRRRARLKLLGRRQREEAMRLTVTCSLIEIALTLGLAATAVYLLPESWLLDPLESLFEEGGGGDVILRFLLACHGAAILALEPLYVAGGFCLYLNRRTQLEAWDLEIDFRRIRARLAEAAWPGSRTAALAVLLGLCVLAAPGAPFAEEVGAGAASPVPATQLCLKTGCMDAHRAIADVMSDPAFGSTREVTRWRLRSWRGDPGERRGTGLAALGAAIGSAIEPVFWTAAVLCLVAFILLRHRAAPEGPALGLAMAGGHGAPGLESRRCALPDDIPGAARRLLAGGRCAEAASLLFRGALSELAARDHLPIRTWMTEGQCVDVARRAAAPGRASFLQAVADAWTAAAYGHRPPSAERIGTLIDQWDTHFGGAA